MKRKICVVTSSRADYGHLHCLLNEIQNDSALKLQIVVTGSHLSKNHGLTYKNIEHDGFKIDAKVDILKFDDTSEGITKTIGLGFNKFSGVLKKLNPDVVVVLGDRYEMLSVVTTAYLMGIVIAHIHGGETTQGAVDEAIRHSITKMASIHFVAAEVYRKRVIQLGEHPNRVFNFGAPGLEYLKKMKLLKLDDLLELLDLNVKGSTALVTYHPVTQESGLAEKQVKNILKAIENTQLNVVFTKANADKDGSKINRIINQFCKQDPRKYKFVDNLGVKKYVSCLKNLDLMIGNSSSGLIEAPMFKMPVVNVGDRQNGRIKAKNVIDTDASVKNINKAIKKALSKSFRNFIQKLENPYMRYADGRINFRIKETIKNFKINNRTLKKEFYDLIV